MDTFAYVSNIFMFLISKIIGILAGFDIRVNASAVLPFKQILCRAQSYYKVPKTNSQPLFQKYAIVTGSTSGIGKSLACCLYQMGATVVIASRSATKCLETAEYIRMKYPASQGTLIVKALDVSNLDDVLKFALWYRTKYSNLDLLVNNAALNYVSALSKSNRHTKTCFASAQGYDLAFATNYLGPFLLTELLLPLLMATPAARVLLMSSTSHMLAPTDPLRCSSRGLSTVHIAPRASSPADTGRHVGQWREAYRVTKLAQLLYAAQLQQRIWQTADIPSDLKVTTVSPGLTLTGMVPKSPVVKGLLGHIFYSPDAACNATLQALFDPSLQGGEMVSNSWNFFLHTPLGRKIKGDSVLPPAVASLGGDLYRWSVEEIQNYLSAAESDSNAELTRTEFAKVDASMS